MTDFFDRLIQRSLGTAPVVQPLFASSFRLPIKGTPCVHTRGPLDREAGVVSSREPAVSSVAEIGPANLGQTGGGQGEASVPDTFASLSAPASRQAPSPEEPSPRQGPPAEAPMGTPVRQTGPPIRQTGPPIRRTGLPIRPYGFDSSNPGVSSHDDRDEAPPHSAVVSEPTLARALSESGREEIATEAPPAETRQGQNRPDLAPRRPQTLAPRAGRRKVQEGTPAGDFEEFPVAPARNGVVGKPSTLGRQGVLGRPADGISGYPPPGSTLPLYYAKTPAAPEPRTAAPDINVTIGRVEVRAIQPPDPPAATPRRQRLPALSLEAYLKKRDEGSR